MHRTLLATSVALTTLAAALPAQEILAGLGRTVSSTALDALTGEDDHLGVAYLNGLFYVTARGNMGGTVAPHTIFVVDQNGALVTSFQQNNVGAPTTNPWGWRDGDSDGASLIFGWEGGINVIDTSGAAVNQVVATNGPQAITQPIVATGGPSVYRALAYDPTGNGGMGSIFVGDFAADIREIDLQGNILHTYANTHDWSAYGMALDPARQHLWINSVPNAGEIAEFAIDRTAGTLTPTGRSFQRRSGIQGGLDMIPGGVVDGRGCGYDLVSVEQSAPDELAVYRVDLWDNYPSTNEPRILASRNGGALTDDLALSSAATSFEIVVEDAMAGAGYIGFLDVAGSYRPVGLVGPFKGPWELREFPAPLEFVGITGVPLVKPGTNLSALVPPIEFSLQAVAIDMDLTAVPPVCGVDLPIIATNVTRILYDFPYRVRVSATGTDAFNSNTAEGFFKVEALGGLGTDSIVSVTFDWSTTTNPNQTSTVFDTDQTGMADSFWNGNAATAGCSGTYRNNSHVITGLDFTAPQINLVSTCSVGVENSGVEATNVVSTTGRSYETLTWRFTPGAFTDGETFEVDIDTDGSGVGLRGDQHVGMVVTITLQSGAVVTGELAVDASVANSSSITFL